MSSTLEIQIDGSSDWGKYEQVAEFLSTQLSCKVKERVDGTDQSHLDFELAGKAATLRLEHCRGIFLLSKSNDKTSYLQYRELVLIRTKYFAKFEKRIVFRIPGNALDILHCNGFFGFVKDETFFSFSEVQHCLFALPILEEGLEVAQDMIEVSCSKIDADAKSFPLRNIVFRALTESEYYFNLAIEWIEGGFPLDLAMKDEIMIRSNDRSLSQVVRQHGRKIVQKFT